MTIPAHHAVGRCRCGKCHSIDEAVALNLERVLELERCNGCGLPRKEWGPICGGMTQGDFIHYHSPEWWRAQAGIGDA